MGRIVNDVTSVKGKPLNKPNCITFFAGLTHIVENVSIKGLRAPGSHEVDINWKDGKLTEAVVRPKFTGIIEVVGETLKVMCGNLLVPVDKTQIKDLSGCQNSISL